MTIFFKIEITTFHVFNLYKFNRELSKLKIFKILRNKFEFLFSIWF